MAARLRSPLTELSRLRLRRQEQAREAGIAAFSAEAATYHGLTPSSLVFAALRPSRTAPAVNVVIPSYSPTTTFAGMRTALEVGTLMATRHQWPLRIIALRGAVTHRARATLQEFVGNEFDMPQSLVSLEPASAMSEAAVSREDVWVATYWTTAHALDVACRLGIIDRAKVTYLIQDYEPIFLPGSTASALAAATYHAGFTPLVNSVPLASYLRRFEMVSIENRDVFAPSLDLRRLEEAHARRSKRDVVTVLLYGRPSKPRNMFTLGVSALRSAARRLGDKESAVRFISVGERHRDVALGAGFRMRSLGKVGWAAYFDLLGEVEVTLSLQASPHPSHPPLDTVVSGGVAVTNEMGGTRADLHPRLHAVAADTDTLAETVEECVRSADATPAGAYSPDFLSQLGRPLTEVAERIASQLT